MGVKEDIIRLFYGRCDIYETEHKTDERGVTGEQAVLKYADVECRLVFGGKENFAGYKTAGNAPHKNNTALNIRLFLSPDISVKAGSILNVRQNGIAYSLRSASEPARYRHHQEITAIPTFSEV